MGQQILKIKDLKKNYPGGFGLNIGELSLGEDKTLVLIGPNGSGKSTLIKLINLLEEPDEGQIIFNGADILKSGKEKPLYRKMMAAVFQEPLLYDMSVYNNIILGLNLRKIKIKDKKEVIDYLVEKLQLNKLLLRNPKSLSGGEQQRVALARALVLEPKLLLLDEPLANIDQLSREELRKDLFGVLKDMGRSILYVTHDRNEAMMLADDIAVINKGKIEQSGSRGDVFGKPANEFVAKFVGIESLLEGIVMENVYNVCRVKINGTSIFAVSGFCPGQHVTAAVRPEDVTLYSADNIKSKNTADSYFKSSSALNLLSGRITEIQDSGIFKKIEVDCGFKMISFVTANSIERMDLKAGKEVNASFKASSVHLFEK